MTQDPPRVLVTGGSGSVGRSLCAGLPAAGWVVRQIDREPPEHEPPPPHEAVVGDAFDPDTLARALDGCAAVVHLAAVPGEAPLTEIAASHVVGTGVVLEAARAAGIDRFVLASSNHAVGFTRWAPIVGTDVRPRPDTYYGVGKVAAEALCSLYSDRYGMRVACIRIGTFRERPETRRHLSTLLTPGDLVRLVDACLRAPDLTYAVVYGISANTRGWWDLGPGRALGYDPVDDAEAWAESVLSTTPEPEDDDPDEAFLGGSFTRADNPGIGLPAAGSPGEEPSS